MDDGVPQTGSSSPLLSQGVAGGGEARSRPGRLNWLNPYTLIIIAGAVFSALLAASGGIAVNWLIDISADVRHVRDEVQEVRKDLSDDVAAVRINVHGMQKDIGVLQGQRTPAQDKTSAE